MKTEGREPLLTPSAALPSTASTSARNIAQSSTLCQRVAVLVAILMMYGILNSTRTMPSTDMNLSESTTSIFVPFIHKFSIKHDLQVLCTVDGVEIEMPIDTGSTGLLIGAPILPNVSPSEGKPAHHFFTSSKILYVGRLVELSVGFHGEGSSYATATVPVLIVDKSWRCPWYDTNKDRFNCPPGPHGERAMERDISRITYMGVGFGRNLEKDGMPYGTPNINPFLNIDALNGRPVTSKSMRAGYTISTAGVHLGVTSGNTDGFAFVQLDPGSTHDSDPKDWAMVNMCFRADNGEPNCGAALVDTGISQMYLRPAEGVAIPIVHVRNPNKNSHTKMVKRVRPGTSIAIGFSSLKTPTVLQSFVVGGRPATEPSAVIPLNQTHPPYVNTGRSFLLDYSIAFDAIGGRFGFRPTNSPSSSSVL